MMTLPLLLVVVFAGQVPAVTPSIQDPAAGPSLLRLAVELSPGEPVTAIPAEPGATTQHALVYDWFRLVHLGGRAAALKGTRLDVNHLPALIATPRLVVVGLPVSCGGRNYPPTRVQMAEIGGATLHAVGDAVSGDALTAMLPGETLPAGAMAMTFERGNVHAGDVITVTYPTGACGDRVVVSPPARVIDPHLSGFSRPALAPGAPVPEPMPFEFVIDLYGVPKYLVLNNVAVTAPAPGPQPGPPAQDMTSRATQSLLRWHFEPATVNGVAVPSVYRNTLTFTTPTAPLTGANANAPAPQAPAPPPRPDLQQLEMNMERLAIELASKGGVQGISLDADGSARHGWLFDRFRMGVVMARAQIAAGTTPEPSHAGPGRGLFPSKMVVVALPLTCDGALNMPRDIAFTGASGPAARKIGANASGSELAALLPGVQLPDGTIAASYPNTILTEATVSITYEKAACPGPSPEASLHLSGGGSPHILDRVMNAKLPSDMTGDPPTRVYVSFTVDLDGRPRFATALEGSPALHAIAEEAASRWRYDPSRLNGAPMPTSMSVPIVLTADGQPAPMGPPGAPGRIGGPAGIGPGANAPPIAASSRGGINGGDATHDTSSGDIPGLTLATSKCAVADDELYGFAVDHAIKVGVDMFTGPAREVKYLNALRGPSGQGIHFRRLGSLPSPDRTILDAYEITYAGLDKPLHIYLDEYHFDDPRAPRGLLCGVAIGLTAK